MAEYIEREALLEKVKELSNTYSITGLASVHIIKAIEDAPKVDVVERVKCKDCEYRTEKGICEKFRQRYPFYPEDDFHCGYGKRKEGAEE